MPTDTGRKWRKFQEVKNLTQLVHRVTKGETEPSAPVYTMMSLKEKGENEQEDALEAWGLPEKAGGCGWLPLKLKSERNDFVDLLKSSLVLNYSLRLGRSLLFNVKQY